MLAALTHHSLAQAPVSLAGSLEEYIKDPNFEANRLEYKQNREIAEGKPSKGMCIHYTILHRINE